MRKYSSYHNIFRFLERYKKYFTSKVSILCIIFGISLLAYFFLYSYIPTYVFIIIYLLELALIFLGYARKVKYWFHRNKEIKKLQKKSKELDQIEVKEQKKIDHKEEIQQKINENNLKVKKFIEEKKPQIVVMTISHFGNYKMYGDWHEILKELNLPFFVFTTKEQDLFGYLENIPDIQVIYGRQDDLKKYIPEDTKIFLYPLSFAMASHTIRLFGDATHILIGHGDSEKKASASKNLRIFDKFCVAGERAIERFKEQKIETLPDFFQIIGRPGLSEIEPAKEEKTIKQIKTDNSQITFLYAPTYRGFHADDQHSSIENAYQIVEFLIKQNYKVIFRPHPALTYQALTYSESVGKKNELQYQDAWEIEKIKDLLKDSGNQYSDPYAEKPTLVDLINQSDVIITDVSSVVSESLLSRKPILINSDIKNTAEFEKNYEIARFNYVIDQDLGNLGEVVEEVLTKDPKKKERIAKIPYYLGSDDPKKMFPMFEKAIQEALKESQA